MVPQTLRRYRKELVQGFSVALILLLAVFSSPHLREHLGSQAAVSRANLVVTTVLSGMLLFVYTEISSAEQDQSNQIESQVEVMKDQLAAAHRPQIAVDTVSFDRSGVSYRFRNLGNGPASGIYLEPSLEVWGDSGFDLEVYWVNHQWQRDEGDYLEAGDSGQFSYLPELLVRKDGEEVFRGGIGDVAELLYEEDIDSIHWETEISFDTVLGDTVKTELAGHVVTTSTLTDPPEYL